MHQNPPAQRPPTSLVVSPQISTVMPLILFAMRFHLLLRESMKKAAPKDCSVYIQLLSYCKQLTLLCTSCSQKVHSPRMRQTCVNHVSNICIPQKCNETMVLYNVYFTRFYVIYATFSPFGNMRFVTKLKCFLANLRCFRDFLPITFECNLKQEHVFCYVFSLILRCFCHVFTFWKHEVVTKLKCLLANLRCFRVFLPITFECNLK